MLTVSAAFAAPLVRIMGLQPFGINLFGESEVGKTTALLAATSIIGIGRESMLTNWNASAASFGESAKVFNDSILAANEVGLLAGRRSDAYPKIRALIYQFAEGKEKARHSASQYASNTAESVWSGIFVSTAEYSFNDYASRSGERERSGGEYARCLDVPATGSKASTIFDRDTEKNGESMKRAAARKLLVNLRLACERHRGRPIKAYIDYLLKHSDLKGQIQKHMEGFYKAYDTSTLDGALQHAAQYFALIYAGGRLAIAAGILPWNRKDLRAAVVQCFDAAVDEVDKYDNALEKAKKRL